MTFPPVHTTRLAARTAALAEEVTVLACETTALAATVAPLAREITRPPAHTTALGAEMTALAREIIAPAMEVTAHRIPEVAPKGRRTRTVQPTPRSTDANHAGHDVANPPIHPGLP